MTEVAASASRDRVLDVVVGLLETEGYDGWPLSAVAKQARVSLRDVYKHFPTRGDLVAAAFVRWMAGNAEADMLPPPDARLPDALMWCFRRLLEPWEKHPRLLEAYQRARLDPAGRNLDDQGLAAFRRAMREVTAGLDRRYAADLAVSLRAVTQGLITQVMMGEMPLVDVLPNLERTIVRLTSDNAHFARDRR